MHVSRVHLHLREGLHSVLFALQGLFLVVRELQHATDVLLGCLVEYLGRQNANPAREIHFPPVDCLLVNAVLSELLFWVDLET